MIMPTQSGCFYRHPGRTFCVPSLAPLPKVNTTTGNLMQKEDGSGHDAAHAHSHAAERPNSFFKPSGGTATKLKPPPHMRSIQKSKQNLLIKINGLQMALCAGKNGCHKGECFAENAFAVRQWRRHPFAGGMAAAVTGQSSRSVQVRQGYACNLCIRTISA